MSGCEALRISTLQSLSLLVRLSVTSNETPERERNLELRQKQAAELRN